MPCRHFVSISTELSESRPTSSALKFNVDLYKARVMINFSHVKVYLWRERLKIMQIYYLLFFFLLLFLVVFGKPHNSRMSAWCFYAVENNPVEECVHGELTTPCGVVCKKGPGDICGGSGDQYGVCGNGLFCSNCNKCTGCSFTSFECFDDRQCLSLLDVWL